MEENERKDNVVENVINSNELSSVIDISVICRICANSNEKLIAIYSDDGVSNDLSNKINLYLPIKVSEDDELPLYCCWECANSIISWHSLVVTSVTADTRLRNYYLSQKDTTDLSPSSYSPAEISFESSEEKVTVEQTSLNAFCQTEGSIAAVIIDAETPLNNSLDKKEELITYFDNTNEKPNNEVLDNLVVPTSFTVSLNEKDLDEYDKEIEDDNDTQEDIKLERFNFVCQFCPAMFVLEEHILNHAKEEHPEQMFEVEATNSFDVKKEKRKHTKIDQEVVNSAKVEVDGRIFYMCKQCGKSLHSPYTYVWHMRIHTGERPYVCHLCGKQFRVSQGLVRHLRETHEGVKNFPCDLCGRMFATRRNVEEHRRIHTNERPYVCNLCGKSFKQKASLFVHNRSHSNSFPFKCTYCSRGFRTKPPLMIHITRHTGEKPYPCDICGRCFRIKYELKRHRLVHSDEKPFTCSSCGLGFRQKRYLRNHNRMNHLNATAKWTGN